MAEYKAGRYKSPAQAIAVAYSQVQKKRPGCKKSLKKGKKTIKYRFGNKINIKDYEEMFNDFLNFLIKNNITIGKCGLFKVDDCFKKNGEKIEDILQKYNCLNKDFSNLSDILNSKKGVEKFKNFLNGEHSSENIDFWLAVDAYKKKPDQNTARNIYEEFVSDNAKTQVNLSASNKTNLDEIFNSDKNLDEIFNSNKKNKIFDNAQNEIFILMSTDSLKRFKEGEQNFDELIKECGE
jgi:hypothetical protein